MSDYTLAEILTAYKEHDLIPARNTTLNCLKKACPIGALLVNKLGYTRAINIVGQWYHINDIAEKHLGLDKQEVAAIIAGWDQGVPNGSLGYAARKALF